jgi:signal transduction histidine kinase
VTDHEQRRLAAPHEYRLLDAPADDELEAVVRVAAVVAGAGPSTCRRIVERHGGRTWVDGAPGGGATVTFTLPDA